MKRGEAKQTKDDDNDNVVQLQSDMQALQSDIGRIGRRLNIIANRAVQSSRENLSERATATRETVAANVAAGQEKLGVAADNGRKYATKQTNNLRKQVKSRPIASCAIALGAGVVVGSMLRNRKSAK
jgi:hypothetical protein